MRDAPRHTYQILTKRPERMVQVAPHLPLLSNVWLGTSVEDDRVLDRIDALGQVLAAIRFVSFETLIGSVCPRQSDRNRLGYRRWRERPARHWTRPGVLARVIASVAANPVFAVIAGATYSSNSAASALRSV